MVQSKRKIDERLTDIFLESIVMMNTMHTLPEKLELQYWVQMR